jgi:hypothetical protein
MEAVQMKNLTDVQPGQLLAVNGGVGPLASYLVAGLTVSMVAAGAWAIGTALGKTERSARDMVEDIDESVPVAPAT